MEHLNFAAILKEGIILSGKFKTLKQNIFIYTCRGINDKSMSSLAASRATGREGASISVSSSSKGVLIKLKSSMLKLIVELRYLPKWSAPLNTMALVSSVVVKSFPPQNLFYPFLGQNVLPNKFRTTVTKFSKYVFGYKRRVALNIIEFLLPMVRAILVCSMPQ